MADLTADQIKAKAAKLEADLQKTQQDRLKLTVSLLAKNGTSEEDAPSSEKQERIIEGNI